MKHRNKQYDRARLYWMHSAILRSIWNYRLTMNLYDMPFVNTLIGMLNVCIFILPQTHGDLCIAGRPSCKWVCALSHLFSDGPKWDGPVQYGVSLMTICTICGLSNYLALHLPNAVSMLVHRLRRCPNIETALAECPVFAGRHAAASMTHTRLLPQHLSFRTRDVLSQPCVRRHILRLSW